MTSDQRHFRDRLLDLDREWASIATRLDLAETKAAAVSGKREWSDETELAYETAVLSIRRV